MVKNDSGIDFKRIARETTALPVGQSLRSGPVPNNKEALAEQQKCLQLEIFCRPFRALSLQIYTRG
jgi:hypothetical protein